MNILKVLFAFFLATSAFAQKKPNVIIIFADDMGYGDLSSFGHPYIRTPHIDDIGRNGARLTSFYVGASVCSPSRAALMTGRYPVRSGMTGNRFHVLFPFSNSGLPKDEITLPEALKPAGYTTGMVGKWHLGHLPGYQPTDNGFDYYYGIPYSNDMGYQDDRAHPFKKMFPPLPIIENGKVVNEKIDQTHLTKDYTEKCIEFIDKNKDKPFFLYYASNFPHVPLYSSNDFKGKSRRGEYGDVVEELDWSVGQILEHLKKNNLDKNTMVIFTSDNGPWTTQGAEGGSAGLLKAGKASCWEGGMRVPAVVQFPGVIPANQVIEGNASTMDLYTTIIKMAGGNVPQDRVVDGKDIMPLLTGKVRDTGEPMFYYHGPELFAVRKGKWKMHMKSVIPYQDITQHVRPLLYNLENDPGEQYNLSASHPEVVAELQKLAEEHKKSVEKKPYVFDDVTLTR